MEVKKKIPSAFEDEEKQNFLEYTDEEAQYRSFLIDRLEDARDMRDTNHPEFNDMTYCQWYDENAKAANSYNPPKTNKEDTRIVTGTTQEKANTLLSALLNYNLEPNITAFNKHNIEIAELGELMEDLLLKSRKMEYYDEKRPLIYKELMDQGTVFVEEVKVERIKVEKKLKNESWSQNGVKVSAIKWEQKLKKLYAECECRVLEGKSVYLGNIREYDLQKQPFAFIYDRIPFDEAKYVYGDWDRFEFVPRKVVKFSEDDQARDEYRDWTLLEDDGDFVEVIKYQDPLNNEYQILLNGVMMLPVGFPLTAICPAGTFSFAKGDLEPISQFFSYSRSIPSKSKVDQASLDEMLRLVILKTKQSFMPPMANNTGRVLGRKIFYPGSITNDINPTQLTPMIQSNGVTQSEFNTFQLLKKLIDEKTVSPAFSGDMTQGKTTATEINEVKKQQMMKLGATILGVISLERQMCSLRLPNILSVWTKPIDQTVDEVRGKLKDIYRMISTETSFDNGEQGERIVSFDPEKAEQYSSDDLSGMEKSIKEKYNRNVKLSFVNSKELMNFEANFHITITPTERDTSALDRVLFVKDLTDAMTLFGPQSVNIDYAKERYASQIKEDPEKFFVPTPPPMGVPGQPAQGGMNPGAEMMQGVAAGIKAPSLNTLSE